MASIEEHDKDHSSDMLDQNRPGQHEQGDNSQSILADERNTIMALREAPSDLEDTFSFDLIQLHDIIETGSDISDLSLEHLEIEAISPLLGPPEITDYSATGDGDVAEVELALNNWSVDLQEVQIPKQASPPSSDPESPASHRSDDEQSSSDSASHPPSRADLATVVNDDNSSEIPLRRRTNARFIDFYESSISYYGNYGSKRLLLSDQNDPSYVPNARKSKKRVRQRSKKRVPQRRTTTHIGRHYNNTPLVRTPASRNEQDRELPQADESSTDQLAGPSTSRALSTNPPNTTTRKRTKAPNYRESPISFSSGYSYNRLLPVQEDLSYVPPSLIRKKTEVEKRRVMQTGRFRDRPSMRAHVSPKETSENRANDEPIRENEGIINVKKDNLKTGENLNSTAIDEETNRNVELDQATGDRSYVPPSLIRKKTEVEKRREQTGRFRDRPSMRAHVSPKETSENRANDEPIRENEGIINVKKDNLKTGENLNSTAIDEETNRNVELDQAIGQRIGLASPVLGDDEAKRVRQRRTAIHKGRHNNTSLIRTPASRNEQHRELPQVDDSVIDHLAGPSTSRALSTNPSNTTAYRRTKAPNYRESPISFSSDYSYNRFLPVQEDLSYVPPSLIRKEREVKKRRVMQTGRFRDSPSMRAHVSPKETSENRANDEPLREKEDVINVKKDNLKTGENSKSTAIEEGTNQNLQLHQATGDPSYVPPSLIRKKREV